MLTILLREGIAWFGSYVMGKELHSGTYRTGENSQAAAAGAGARAAASAGILSDGLVKAFLASHLGGTFHDTLRYLQWARHLGHCKWAIT